MSTDAAVPEATASAPHDEDGAQAPQQHSGPSSAPSGPWEWLGPLAPWFAHLLPGVGPPPQQEDRENGGAGGGHGGAAPGPVCDAAPANHGQLPRGVSDAIPWYRPFYWSPTTDAEAQAALHGVLPFIGCPAVPQRTAIPYPEDPEPCYVQSVTVRAADAGWTGSGKPLTVVILPGYDAGGLFYFRQLARLARLGCDVHAVDLLGHGLSSRPQFKGTTREQGEAFYTDALQHWAEAQGLESYVLMGHSFGGYVSACWALAHPTRCLRLILVGSAGMETHNRACLGHNGQPWGLEGPALEAFNALWYAIQPQAVVRMAGPLGPSIAADYIQRKFGPRSAGGHLSEPESEALQQYCFHCLAGGGRGAVANPPPHHALFFGPGAKCYAPLASRLDDLECPISFVYGLYDWMDWRDADRVRHTLSRPATLSLVENAGHHVYLENPEGFHDALATAMADFLPDGPASAAPQWASTTFPGSGAHHRKQGSGYVPGAGKNQPGAPLQPPQLFFGICRYPSGFEDAAVDEELELVLADVEAECEPGSNKTGAVPYSDRHKDFSLHSN